MEANHQRIQSVINFPDTSYRLCQFALQLQHECVEFIRQLSYKTCNADIRNVSVIYNKLTQE